MVHVHRVSREVLVRKGVLSYLWTIPSVAQRIQERLGFNFGILKDSEGLLHRPACKYLRPNEPAGSK